MAEVERADVVIVGAGLLGLATAYALRGRREVLVVERETVGHARGGSHGPSRIFRLGYPDPVYVHLARLAQAGWRELEATAGTALLTTTGQLSFGPGAYRVLDALTAAGAPVEMLDADSVAARFPMFEGHGPAVFESESGVLAADAVLRSLRTAAACEVRQRVRVRRVADHEDGVRVETSAGVIEARAVVVTAGPWTRELLPSTPTFATLEHVAYLHPRRAGVAPPVFIDHHEPAIYGLPTPGTDEYKIALHHAGAVVDAEATDLQPDPRAVDALIAATRVWLPDFDPEGAEIDTCLYDNTIDEDFILDRAGHVVVGAGTSGHGFKFGVVLGELLAGLVLGAAPRVDLARFRADRAASAGPSGIALGTGPVDLGASGLGGLARRVLVGRRLAHFVGIEQPARDRPVGDAPEPVAHDLGILDDIEDLESRDPSAVEEALHVVAVHRVVVVAVAIAVAVAVAVRAVIALAVPVPFDLVEHDLDVGGGPSDDAAAEEPFGVGGGGDERRHPHRRQRVGEAGDCVHQRRPFDAFRFDAIGRVVQDLTKGGQRAREVLVAPGQVGAERVDGFDERDLRAPAAVQLVVQADLHSCRELRQSRVYLGLDLCPTSSPPRPFTPRHAVAPANLWNTTVSAPFPRILGGNTLIATVGCRGFVENSPAAWSGGRGEVPAMVPDLVHGVAPDPLDRPVRGLRVVVDAGAGPARRVDRVQRPRQRSGGRDQLLGGDRGILLVVAAFDDALLPTHGDEHRVVLGLHQQDPLPLDVEHVADVTCVLQRRPDGGRGPRPHPIIRKKLERAPERRGVRPYGRRDLGPGQRVVVVAALVAVHRSTLRPPNRCRRSRRCRPDSSRIRVMSGTGGWWRPREGDPWK